MQSDLVIAIDGPAGAGKSTVAEEIADRLEIIYIDTGAMYRALTLEALRAEINLNNEDKLADLVQQTEIELKKINGEDRVLLNGEDVSQEIRSQEVSNYVSLVAKVSAVREQLVKLQRKMARNKGVIMDGRDIGTVVLPDADLKIFLTASVEERTRRRYSELQNKGEVIEFDELKEEILRRDKLDKERKVAPLKKAEDAIELDSTDLTSKQVIRRVIKLCQEEL